ncbi:HAMP domain-containing sensor histidine kinase [Geothrix sp. PMB-07]|uniref:sensor histidine kinase n=1 Tax=Geothrix sp. PMB-07 TaxID=3068640 RepID=UPI002742912C|nr:histidine kinase dimerization/phospho-acceptor domain-containing protein [Geothrix sp. PMB-07]WLT30919.1 hypothetical protein Q9293_14475 [Geothrix sp. PMB-07]
MSVFSVPYTPAVYNLFENIWLRNLNLRNLHAFRDDTFRYIHGMLIIKNIHFLMGITARERAGFEAVVDHFWRSVNHYNEFANRIQRLWIGFTNGLYRLNDLTELISSPSPYSVVLSLPAVDVFAHLENLNFLQGMLMPLRIFSPRVQYIVKGIGSQSTEMIIGNMPNIMNLQMSGYRFLACLTMDGISGHSFASRLQQKSYNRLALQALGVISVLATLIVVWRWRITILQKRNHSLEIEVGRRTERLLQKNREIEDAHTQIRKTLEARIQHTLGIVHDLRGPLTSISLIVQSIDGETVVFNDRMLGIIKMEAKRLEQLAGRLLDASRLQHVLPASRLRLIVPSQAIEGLVDGFKIRAEAVGIRFHYQETPSSRDVRILGDPLGPVFKVKKGKWT